MELLMNKPSPNDRNTCTMRKVIKKRVQDRNHHLYAVTQTKKWIRDLPHQNYQNCEKFHEWFINELVEIKMGLFAKPELCQLIHETIKREDEQYAEEIRYHKKRLNWKTKKDSTSTHNIQWLER